MAGAGLKSVWNIYKGIHIGAIANSELMLFPIGLIAAAISGYLCIKYLLRFLQKNSTVGFVYYRWILALLIVAAAYGRI